MGREATTAIICAILAVLTFVVYLVAYIRAGRVIDNELERSERIDRLARKSADILSAQNEEIDALLNNIAEMKKAVGTPYSEAEEGVSQMVQAIQKETGCDVGLEGSIIYKPHTTLTACVPTIDSEKPLLARACPNCGAPVRGAECEYCGSVFAKDTNVPCKRDYGDGERRVRIYDPDAQQWVWVPENPMTAVKTSKPPTTMRWS